MTGERTDKPTTHADPSSGQPSDDAKDRELLKALRELSSRVEHMEGNIDRLLSARRPEAGTPPPGRPRGPTLAIVNPEADERHSRIADRFAERAAWQDQPPPFTGHRADGGRPGHDDPDRHEGPELGADRSDLEYRNPKQRVRRRRATALVVWLGVGAAIVGAGYYLYTTSPNLQERVQATYGEALDREPDAVIQVEGQSPLTDEGERLETAGTATGSATPESAAGGAADQAAAEAGRETPPGDAGSDRDIGASGDASAGAAGVAATSAETTGADATADDDAAAAETTDQPAEPDDGTTIVPAPRQTAGPEVEAAPRGDVEFAELSDLDTELAPLPPDVDADVRRIAGLALEGNPEAQHDLATLYALGQLVPQNYERAAYWYRRSADGGIENARYNLGVLIERGLGVPQDSEAAYALFLQAAEAGHPDAQNAVGLAHMHGHGTDRDLLAAASWFQGASAAGNPRGAFHLGRLFEQGLEGAPDYQAAAGWYRLAAEAGDVQAEEALARLLADTGLVEAPTEPPPPVPIPETTPDPVAPASVAARSTASGGAAETGLGRDEIREIQERLTAAGFDPGPVDGLMGQRTRNAIESYQRDRGIAVSGEPSQALLSALRSAGGN